MLWRLETGNLGDSQEEQHMVPSRAPGWLHIIHTFLLSVTHCHIPHPCSILSWAALLQHPEDVVKGCLPVMGLCKVRLSILMELQRDAGEPEQEGMGKD